MRHHRRESTLGEEDGSRHANDYERDDPTENSLAHNEPVDTFATLEHGDTNGGTNLAVSGGKRPAHARTHDDDTAAPSSMQIPRLGVNLAILVPRAWRIL